MFFLSVQNAQNCLRLCSDQFLIVNPSATCPFSYVLSPVGQGEDISENQSTLIPVPHDLPHFPHKEAYPLSETYRDLINLADRFLRPGGRLVFWIPVKREMNFGLNRLPTHPRLRLLCACEQILNGRNSRYMVAMEKLKPTESDECETRDARVISPADPVVP
ncbi:putative RNA methylase [Fasciola hepatica]|uniref:RNA methylase n=1 Tax=Fasciola hepatica TaxID=6192 RepID=A0A4E0QTN8_FASHE|nr:putative RNA methylase [Fasciola hepatica]